MKYKVLHSKEPNFGMGEHPVFNDENFELVAEVECDGHGEVFRLTNTIDDVWWNNPEVKAIKVPCRSTSVGDVVERVEDGQLFRCEGTGWTEFTR
jgi:hypothetical protein